MESKGIAVTRPNKEKPPTSKPKPSGKETASVVVDPFFVGSKVTSKGKDRTFNGFTRQ
jgi:hypothetical protein